MKNIFKTTIFAFLLLALASCTNDNDPIAQASGDFKLLAPSNGTSYTLLPANEKSVITTLVWDYADNGVQSASSYTIELAKSGTNFAKIISGGTTADRYFPFTVEQLNGLLSPADFTPYQAASVDVRIKSSLGTTANALVQYSNVITLKLTPYSTALPKIGVPGAHQDWKPNNSATLPLLASSGFGKSDFEGYATLGGAFKFLSPKADGTFDWGTTDWGDDKSNSGKLLESGEGDCNATAGYYLIRADTGKLTYSATLISTWGIIGDGTSKGWDASTPMTYNATTKVWTVTTDLTAKKFKFRANDAWDIDLGDYQADKPGVGDKMSYKGKDITIPSDGNYTITLDLSSPRNYKYTLTKN
jgi:hypothetical protein